MVNIDVAFYGSFIYPTPRRANSAIVRCPVARTVIITGKLVITGASYPRLDRLLIPIACYRRACDGVASQTGHYASPLNLPPLLNVPYRTQLHYPTPIPLPYHHQPTPQLDIVLKLPFPPRRRRHFDELGEWWVGWGCCAVAGRHFIFYSILPTYVYFKHQILFAFQILLIPRQGQDGGGRHQFLAGIFLHHFSRPVFGERFM